MEITPSSLPEAWRTLLRHRTPSMPVPGVRPMVGAGHGSTEMAVSLGC